MKLALADKPATPFKVPAGIRLVRVDAKSGMRPGPGEGGRTILEAFKPGTAPPDNYSVDWRCRRRWTRAAGSRRLTPAISCVPEPAGFISGRFADCALRRSAATSDATSSSSGSAPQTEETMRAEVERLVEEIKQSSRAAEEASLTSRHPRLASPS